MNGFFWQSNPTKEMQRIKHSLRSAYGYTDAQILEHITEFGEAWAIECYEMIMEDENRHWQLLVSIAPLARTPMDKKFGKELNKYSKELRKNISKILVPWEDQRRIKALKDRLDKPPVSKVYDENGKEVDLNDPDWWKKEV